MKRNLHRIALLLSAVLMVLTVVAFAACEETKARYTLTFVAEGCDPIPSIEAEAGADITPPVAPDKDGYVFRGWYEDAEFGGDAVELPAKMPESNKTYYAKFVQLVRLNFYGEGDDPFSSIEKEAGADITPPVAPDKDGYVFKGWYEDANFGGNAVQLPTQMPDSDKSYYAKYAKLYTLRFVAEGCDPIDDIEAEAGESITPPQSPLKDGFVFKGWYEDANFDGSAVQLPTEMPDSDKTYYAKFAIVGKLSFVAEGCDPIDDIEAEAGESITPPQNPAKDGYVFKGWYEDANFGGNAVQLPTEMPDSDKTYYAKFAKLYTLRFVAEGCDPIDDIEAEAGESITPPQDPAKDGFVFKGWYEDANFDGSAVQLPTEMPDSDKAYYAKFAKRITVTFHDGLGDTAGTMDPQSAVAGEAFDLNGNSFSAKGHMFLGWASEAEGELDYEDCDRVTFTDDTDLYAIWLTGLANKFEKDTYLYLISTEDVVLEDGETLRRGLLDVSRMTFTADSLHGRIFTDGTFALYGDQLLGSYKEADYFMNELVEGGNTLEFYDHGIAAYVEGGAVKQVLSYVYDAAEEYYTITEGASVYNVRLGMVDESDVFFKQAVHGSFRSVTGDTLTLNGFGNATLAGSDTSYTKGEGENLFTVGGKNVRVKGETYAVYNEVAKGSFTHETETLTLDGYDVATLGGTEGTYYVVEKKDLDGVFVHVTVQGVGALYRLTKSDSSFEKVGEEIGTYDRYAEWTTSVTEGYSSYAYQITLDGAGNATIKRHTSWSFTYTDYATGTYQYNEETKRYDFTSGDGSPNELTMSFKLQPHATNGSLVYVQYVDSQAGTFHSGSDTLELDGCGWGVYTVGGNRQEGRVKFDSSDATRVTFTADGTSKDTQFVLDKAGNTFSIPTLVSGTFYNRANKGTSGYPKDHDLRMQLDMQGNAKVEYYDDWGEDWQSYATGTYALVEGTTDIFRYTPVSNPGKQGEFLFTASGAYYSEVVAGDPENYTADGATLTTDGLGNATYTKGEETHSGSIDASAPEGYLFFTEYGTSWRFRLDEQSFVLLGEEYGEYTLTGHDSLTLDGEGHATLGDLKGTYAPSGEGFRFTSDTLTFEFKLDDYNRYLVAYENADIFLGATDFTSLEVEPYGVATWYDESGVPTQAEYTIYGEHILMFERGYRDIVYFRLDFETHTFATVEGDFVIDGGVLYAYLGNSEMVILPEEVKVIGAEVFLNRSTVLSVVGTNIVRIEDKAFYGASHLETLVLHGSAAPEMVGSDIFSYNVSTIIVADDLTTALSWYAAESWANYVKYLGYATEQSATYFNVADLSSVLVLDKGLAKEGNFDRWLYDLTADTLTLYQYSSGEENKYTVESLALTNGAFTRSNNVYAPEGKQVTYKENDDTLVVTLGEDFEATFNGGEVSISVDSSGEMEFDVVIDGVTYTVTTDTYSANISLTGTFESNRVFKPVTTTYYGKYGTENANKSIKITQTGPNAYKLESTAYLTVDGQSVTLRTGSSTVLKTAKGFDIIDTYSSSALKLYHITIDGSYFTEVTVEELTKEQYETTGKIGTSNCKIGLVVYKDGAGNIITATLQLPRYSASTYSSMYDVTAPCTINEDGTITITVEDGDYYYSYAEGYTFTFTIDQEAGTCTVEVTKD